MLSWPATLGAVELSRSSCKLTATNCISPSDITSNSWLCAQCLSVAELTARTVLGNRPIADETRCSPEALRSETILRAAPTFHPQRESICPRRNCHCLRYSSIPYRFSGSGTHVDGQGPKASQWNQGCAGPRFLPNPAWTLGSS